MTVQQLQGIGGGKGQGSCDQLVKGHAQEIKIRTIVNASIHPPRLLRRNIRQRPLQAVGTHQLLLLLRQ